MPSGKIKFKGEEFSKLQWKLLEALEPGWISIKKRGAFHGLTINGMVRRGYVEVREYPEAFLIRLTKAGIEVRNQIHIREARAHEYRIRQHIRKVNYP